MTINGMGFTLLAIFAILPALCAHIGWRRSDGQTELGRIDVAALGFLLGFGVAGYVAIVVTGLFFAVRMVMA